MDTCLIIKDNVFPVQYLAVNNVIMETILIIFPISTILLI